MNPVAAGIENDQLVPASGLADAGGGRVGSNADGFFVHQRSALGVSQGKCAEGKQDGTNPS
jgi:hypothetical protein